MARSPDYATMKDKMMTASSREALRRGFYGVNVEIKGSDYSEVEYDAGELFPSSPALRTYFLP